MSSASVVISALIGSLTIQARAKEEGDAKLRMAQEEVERLAKEAGYSNEHLRRLCRKQLGRSPMHQVTYLRMRRAAELLASTDQTIESISQEIGYQNPFVFSNAFTKWIGWRPSEYRRKKFNKA